MLKVCLEIDNQTFELAQRQGEKEGKTPQQVLAQRLMATRTLPVGTNFLVVTAEDRETLAQILAGGSLINSPDLVRKVERLAGVSFLHCRLPFTPNQLEALKEKAERNSLTVEQLVERTAPRIYEQFFDLVARV